MCRLAAFPPNFPREDAIEILRNFENNNVDGTGAAWVEDGHFVVEKYPKSLTKVLRRHKTFLDHMPYNGWTIAHLRAASCGEISTVNTHPFVTQNGKWVICHNGGFSEHKIVRLALGKTIKFEGETDSEVAAELLASAGPKAFAENVDFSGVFLSLNIRGDLWAIKTSGQLELQALKRDRVLLASALNPQSFENAVQAQVGWYHFNREGEYIKHCKIRDSHTIYRSQTTCGTGLAHQLSYGGTRGNQVIASHHDLSHVARIID